MVSKASEDLPDPLTPVKTISCPAGRVRSTFLRLCVRAPRITRADELTCGGMIQAEDYRREFRRAGNLQFYSIGRRLLRLDLSPVLLPDGRANARPVA